MPALALQAQTGTTDRVAAAYQMKTRYKSFVSAHRGGAAYAPKNTLIAYRNAALMTVDDFETDTTLTKDGKLVLVHDATLDNPAIPRVSGFTFSSPSFSTPDFSAQNVSLVQLHGIKVNPYSTAQLVALERAIGFGVDGIIQLSDQLVPVKKMSIVTTHVVT